MHYNKRFLKDKVNNMQKINMQILKLLKIINVYYS